MCLTLLFIGFIGPNLSFVTLEVAEVFRVTDKGLTKPPYLPSDRNLLGTDSQGRDLLSLLIIGTKNTLLIVFIVTFVRYLIAIPLAIAASKAKGFIHNFLYSWNQIFSGLPTLVAAILLIHLPVFYNSPNRTFWFIAIIALLEIGRVGYLFQQHASDLSKSMFVEAGRAVGNNTLGLYRRYFLPFLLPQMIVSFVIDMGRVLLLLGQLAFFSVFISQAWVMVDIGQWEFQNQSIDWLSMIAESRNEIHRHPWILLFPALAIAFTILSFNILGEGLRLYFENVTKRKYYASKWFSKAKLLKALQWLFEFRKPIIVTTTLVVVITSTFTFFYTGYNGTASGKAAHEQKVYNYLTSHYRDTAFTILETTYDFTRRPGYMTTYSYTIAPEYQLGISIIEGNKDKDISDQYKIYFIDENGREQTHIFAGAPTLPANVLAKYNTVDIISYARARSGEIFEVKQKTLAERINDGEFTIPVANSTMLTFKSDGDAIFGNRYAGFMRLLDYHGVDLEGISDNHDIFTDSFFQYSSTVDVLNISSGYDVHFLPTYGDVNLVLSELQAGKPVLMMNRNYNGMYGFRGGHHHDPVILYGYNNNELLGFNVAKGEHIAFNQDDIRNEGLLPHPIASITYNWKRHWMTQGTLFIFPHVFNSQRPEGLELYLLVDNQEVLVEKQENSSLYVKLLAIDTFYKRERKEEFISLAEANNWIDRVDYEYAFYHLFIEEDPDKIAHLIPKMMEEYLFDPSGTNVASYNVTVEDFILLQELQYRYYYLKKDTSNARTQLDAMMSYISREIDPVDAVHDTKRIVRLLQAETLFDLGQYYLSMAHYVKVEEITSILEERGIADKRLDTLRAELEKKRG